MVHSGRSDALGSLFFVVGDFLLLFFFETFLLGVFASGSAMSNFSEELPD